MKNILITGANGQLGSEFQELSKTHNNFTFQFCDSQTLDVTNKDALSEYGKTHKFDGIINCAAYTAVDKAEDEYEKALMVNATAIENLVALARQKNAYLIHISTDFVFDGKKNKPYTESDKPAPLSKYGLSKRAGEETALEYERTLVIRTSWLYSAFGKNFVHTMIRLGQEKESLGVVYDQTGTPTYARDMAMAILKIIEASSDKGTLATGMYHFSNEGVASWYDFAHAIMKHKKLKCKIKAIETHEYPLPATRPAYSVLNKNKIKKTYNLAIPHWHDSLIECLDKIDL
ncbi:MAG: dTDP-4-dehydrorhamnose reductase [Bacteroidetes bacterium]|jgi:dTDP-4-dehydrorhamnose reductase|nr:dTDP-4-dehydrorhamnose reductase [Bacteroidota bacterium]